MRRFAFLAGAAACLLLAGCQGGGPTGAPPAAEAPKADAGVHVLPANSPQLAHIRVEPVRAVPLPRDEVVAPGKIEANPNRVARVAMPVAGRIRQVLVRLGDSVRQAQPLLTVDSPDAGAALTAYRQAMAQRRQAQSTLNKARQDLARLRELYEHRAAPLKDRLAAENDETQAQAAVDQTQAAIDDAEHRLDVLGLKPGSSPEVTVRAPLPGKILDLSVVPGEYRNDTTAPLMTIADLSSVWISADVPETLIRNITRGEYLELELSAFPGQLYRGRVTRIADIVDPQSHTIKVQAEVANAGGKLLPEMFGQIRHNHGLTPGPAVPASSIVQKSGRSIVLVEESPGRFRERAIQTGGRAGAMIAVTGGLAVNERIVTDGAMLLLKAE